MFAVDRDRENSQLFNICITKYHRNFFKLDKIKFIYFEIKAKEIN